MTDLTQYEKGCSPCAIQSKYGLTYAQGYELAERLRKTQELELENEKLKDLLKECQNMIAFKHKVYEEDALIKEIDEVLR